MKLGIPLVLSVFLLAAAAQAQGIYDFTIKTPEGDLKSLNEYKGQVLLIVNTPSKCEMTLQYTGLEKLYERYKTRGFTVLAFPSDSFPDQDASLEHGFCPLSYRTSFPLFSKIGLRGTDIPPLYQYLTSSYPYSGSVTWNFDKFLVDREGHVIARFGPTVDPMDPQLEEDVLRALAQN